MISIVIPAFQEAVLIATTVAAVRQAGQDLDEPFEVIVVDDGSEDPTSQEAGAADRVIRLERNRGKGAALSRGLVEARGEWIVMLDADLGETAAEFPRLVEPIRA
jgi:glycosyltransferase involved in cell wall biosynthesis